MSPHIFAPPLPVLKFFNFLYSTSRSRSWSAVLAITSKPFHGKCQNIQMSPTIVCASFYRFRYITNLNFFTFKSRSTLWSAIFSITPFDSKSNICKWLPHIFAVQLLPIQRYICFKLFTSKKVCQDHIVQFSHLHQEEKNRRK